MTTEMQSFIRDAIRTESDVVHPVPPRVEHAAYGCVTEAAELLDALKKAKFYGKTLDLTNIKEEAGDLLWYLAILFDELDTTFEQEAHRVIAKLKARYPHKFTLERAENRNLAAEREILEK
jgi:NTP pyrophosphatase (non-canonical NTP hydrolase)